MLENDRIDINKTNGSKECDIFHYRYFLDKGFNYECNSIEPCLCNGFHDLMQKAIIFNDVAIASIKENDYKIHFWYTSKNDAINITKISEKWILIIFFYIILK